MTRAPLLALIALLLPRLAGVGSLGGNLAVFFGGIYIVRGFAVAAALAATAIMAGIATGILV